MSNWCSVAAAVNGTTAVLDSCSLKHIRRAGVKDEKREHRTKAHTFANSLPWMVAELVMRERSLEDLEMYVYTLRHAVVDRLNDSRDRREGDGAQGNEAMEGAERNADNFGIFRWAAHEDRDGTREVFHMAICHDSRKEPQFTYSLGAAIRPRRLRGWDLECGPLVGGWAAALRGDQEWREGVKWRRPYSIKWPMHETWNIERSDATW
jgi:hypothetical protein